MVTSHLQGGPSMISAENLITGIVYIETPEDLPRMRNTSDFSCPSNRSQQQKPAYRYKLCRLLCKNVEEILKITPYKLQVRQAFKDDKPESHEVYVHIRQLHSDDDETFHTMGK